MAGVVERRQTLPILANILVTVKGNELSLVGTDLEVELLGRVVLEHTAEDGSITVPARKFMDICRSLPEGAQIELFLEGNKLFIRSERSRFNLMTLPAHEFPLSEEVSGQLEFNIAQQELRKLLENTQFAMAQQDVRYYLNGMLWEVDRNRFVTVATDGHRLAFNRASTNVTGNAQVIVPRKAILELSRLLADVTDDVSVVLSANQLRVKAADYIFTSKLIDGRFPDYEKVIPQQGDKHLLIDRDTLRQALNRVGILANEKHRSVRLELSSNLVKIIANNPEQEEAEEEINVDYAGAAIEIGFNINYLIDALNALPVGMIKISLASADSSARIEEIENGNGIYVVMPMRL